jgi:hypothetical protein
MEIVGDHTYVQGEMNKRKEKWSSKGMDRCPLTALSTTPASTKGYITNRLP